jgi:hypothetical protein
MQDHIILHAILKRTPRAVIEDTSKNINKNYSLIFTTAQLLETSLNQRFARPHQPWRSKHLVCSMAVLPHSHNNHSLTQQSPPIPIYAHHCEIPAPSHSSSQDWSQDQTIFLWSANKQRLLQASVVFSSITPHSRHWLTPLTEIGTQTPLSPSWIFALGINKW